MMNFGGDGKLYFFDQPFQRKNKRSKIPSDSLPFQLRELRVPGGSKGKFSSNLRLKQKDSLGFESVQELVIDSEREEAKAKDEKNAIVDNKRKFSTVDLNFKWKRQSSNGISDIKVIGGIVREDADEDEDTQKFLFEETKFSAPNILSQLGKLLEHIEDKRAKEEKDSRNLHREIEQNYGEKLHEKKYTSNDYILELPNELYHRLNRTYQQLIESTVYTKRLWQSSSYRYLAHALENAGEQVISGSESALVSNVTSLSNNMDKKGELSDVRTKEGGPSSQDRRKRIETSDSISSQNALQDKESRDSGRISDFDPPSIIAYRGESKTSLTQITAGPKTRAERFKFYHVKERPDMKLTANTKIHSQKLTPAFYEAEEEEDTKETRQKDLVIPPLYGPTSVITFAMSSQQCLENGWIKVPSQHEDPERQTLIEWARGQLLLSIKKKEEQEELARRRNEAGPLIIHYYGDTKREVTIKYKKGVSLAKRLARTIDDARSIFETILPDGSGFCLYPSGRIAVCISKRGVGIPGLYHFVYSDSEQSQMLACFSPNGRCCCYHKSGNLRFVSTEKFAAFHEEDGTVTRKWKWAHGKLQTTAIIQLNDLITLRCVNLTQMTLHVNIHGEWTKFNVGGVLECLGSDEGNVPQVVMRPKPTKAERKTRFVKGSRHQIVTHDVSDAVLEERAKELEEKFPERKSMELDTPDLRELHKLKTRVKTLVNDWLGHYRISTGMTSTVKPSTLKKRKDKAHSACSLPCRLPSSPNRQKTNAQRAPSAPPIAKISSHKLLDSKENLQRPHSSAEAYGTSRKSKKGDKRTVRIDVPTSPQFKEICHEDAGALGDITSVKIPVPPQSPGPFRCGIPQQKTRSLILPKDGCPIAIRMELLGESSPQCRCDKRFMPYVSDLEYDEFVQKHVPRTQLIVVIIVSSRQPRNAGCCDEMLDELYYEKNKGRTFPCVQARNDPFRLVRYDICTAGPYGNIALLQRRHNVVPGMFLMYTNGKLIFADYIFNGYGNARKDFLKQVSKSRKEGLLGVSLPVDFKFDARPSRCGQRTAWGGEIGTPMLITQRENTVNEETSPQKPPMWMSLNAQRTSRYAKQPTSVDFVTAGLSPTHFYAAQHELSPKS